VLKHEDFGVTTDLMYAGLNSLSAIKAAALITENTGKTCVPLISCGKDRRKNCSASD